MRRSSSLNKTSAFSPSAKNYEDWTKISDVAERRRIQNRIAQRNYRKRQKRRLEELEYRAASCASVEASHAEPVALPKVAPNEARSNKLRAKKATHNKATDNKADSVYAPTVAHQVSHNSYDNTTQTERGMFGQQSIRQLSASPPPVFSYPSLPSYDGHQLGHGHMPVYHIVPSFYSDIQSTEYGSLVPSDFPGVYAQGIGCKPYYEDKTSPFGMSYGIMADIDLEPKHHAE